MKTNNPPWFLLDLSYLREPINPDNLLKIALENHLKFKCDSELSFSRILEDFGTILGAEISPKLRKNKVKKRCDFKTKLYERTPLSRGRTLPGQAPLAASHMRARSLRKTKNSRSRLQDPDSRIQDSGSRIQDEGMNG